ncbi:dihydrodipicolinate synthase family protein [Microlunatus sp. GCM10028923]|uniref:dihydrodipicolinate synthase family protein n=1 Tax=Microlunatus sp. GCM10028923 TaxID=3273400 RepID=UPI00360F8D41
MSSFGLPSGAWPVLPTAFHHDLTLDLSAMDAVVDFYLEQRVAGIFTCSMSSEVFQLLPEERRKLTERVVARVDGRVPVIAAAIGSGDVASWRNAVTECLGLGVDAAVLITSLLADPDDSDWVLQSRLEAILEAAPEGDLGLYECPVPYKRLLSLDQLRWAAGTGRFVYFKDTSHAVPTMTERIQALAGSRISFYNAEIQSLVTTQRAGGQGFSGLAANIYPGLVGWLCEQWDSGDPRVATVQRLLSVAEHGLGFNYPTSAKFLIAERFGVPIRPLSRMGHKAFTPHQTDPLLDLADQLAADGLIELRPTTAGSVHV